MSYIKSGPTHSQKCFVKKQEGGTVAVSCLSRQHVPLLFFRSFWRGNPDPSPDQTEHGRTAGQPAERSCPHLSRAAGAGLSRGHWKVGRIYYREQTFPLLECQLEAQKLIWMLDICLFVEGEQPQGMQERMAFILVEGWKSWLEVQGATTVVICLLKQNM